MFFEMLIKYCLTCWFKCCLMIWRNCQKAASNAETIERTDGFVMSEMLHLTLKRSDALTGFWIFINETIPNAEEIACIDEFSNFFQWGWIQRWDGWVYWRIFGFVKKLHSTLKRLNALTGFRICQKIASDIETIRCIDGFADLLVIEL